MRPISLPPTRYPKFLIEERIVTRCSLWPRGNGAAQGYDLSRMTSKELFEKFGEATRDALFLQYAVSAVRFLLLPADSPPAQGSRRAPSTSSAMRSRSTTTTPTSRSPRETWSIAARCPHELSHAKRLCCVGVSERAYLRSARCRLTSSSRAQRRPVLDPRRPPSRPNAALRGVARQACPPPPPPQCSAPTLFPAMSPVDPLRFLLYPHQWPARRRPGMSRAGSPSFREPRREREGLLRAHWGVERR
jgi:hypothetical protein